MISPTQFFMPDLWSRLFDPSYVPPEQRDDMSGVAFPATEGEFDQMVAEWEWEEAAAPHTSGPQSASAHGLYEAAMVADDGAG